jgi:hypothetical protein
MASPGGKRSVAACQGGAQPVGSREVHMLGGSGGGSGKVERACFTSNDRATTCDRGKRG